MKIRCHCGQAIVDQTDDVPNKAHFIPDQEWLRVLDALDSDVIDRVGNGTLRREAAYMKSRLIMGKATRFVWQCQHCGRLYVDDRNGNLHCYVPATEETDKEILRSRGASI